MDACASCELEKQSAGYTRGRPPTYVTRRVSGIRWIAASSSTTRRVSMPRDQPEEKLLTKRQARPYDTVINRRPANAFPISQESPNVNAPRRRLLIVAASPLIAFAVASHGDCQATDRAKPAESWRSLFNGKNLEGWTVKIKGYKLGDNFGQTFRVEGGLLKVVYDRYDQFNDRFGHIFYRDKFSHYRLRVEYRFVGEQVPGGPRWAYRNSGIMFHCQAPSGMAIDQDFPVSIEAQMLGGNGRDSRTTGNVCTPGTHIVMDGKLVTRHCNGSHSKTYPGNQWVTLELEVHGNGTIRHIMEGASVIEYERPQLDEKDRWARPLLVAEDDRMLREGTISLQSESHPIEFRKVEILILDAP